MRIFHEPVLLREVLELLKESRPKTFLDCTVGDGGHAWGILSTFQDVILIGIDVDPEACQATKERVWSRFKGRCVIKRSSYRLLPRVLGEIGIPRIDGCLFDLGISSRQVEEWWRGFTYKENAPLDMRMDPSLQRTARDIVMDSSEEELGSIIREYGEERFSFRIAREIVKRREIEPFTSTRQLVSAIEDALPKRVKKDAVHSVSRTFQALRIAVNDELSRLGKALENAFGLLTDGGVLVVISYHSLEDRIVKNTFKKLQAQNGLRVTKKPLEPSSSEVAENSRARSAKLRVIRRRDAQ